jgi:proteasome lid subunit RPN8/RPN11
MYGAKDAAYAWDVPGDFRPAIEHTLLWSARRQLLPFPVVAESAAIVPLWAERGAPYAVGFRVEVAAAGGAGAYEFTRDYFGAQACALRSSLVAQGKFEKEEHCTWTVVARPAAEGPARRRGGWAAAAPRLEECGLEELLHGARVQGPAAPGDPVLTVPAGLLAEMETAALAAFPLETGGVLVGRVFRDRASRDLFTRIEAWVPVMAAATAVKLRFTPEVWARARATIAAEHREASWVGWVHSHPVAGWKDQCQSCPPEKMETCPVATGLLSADDINVQRSVFPAAWQVALVANVLPHKVVTTAFGWREGCMRRIAVHVLDAPATVKPEKEEIESPCPERL